MAKIIFPLEVNTFDVNVHHTFGKKSSVAMRAVILVLVLGCEMIVELWLRWKLLAASFALEEVLGGSNSWTRLRSLVHDL